jgi:adenylylsulfate kinase
MPVLSRFGFTVWLTGLPGVGKTTLARLLRGELLTLGLPVEILDGDAVRRQLTKDLGFTREDRDENIRRIACVAH